VNSPLKTASLFAIAIAIAIAIILCLPLIFVFGGSDKEAELNNSLNSLLKDKFGSSYKVEKTSLHADSKDPSGDWWIVVQGNLPLKNLPYLGIADEYDLTDYKKMVKNTFALKKDLDGFQLLRGEASLGSNTICKDEISRCSLYILYKPNNNNIYLSILDM
jgi:hypothetical protein